MGAVGSCGVGDPRMHGPPVGHANPHIGINALKRLSDAQELGRFLHTGHMDVNQAFAMFAPSAGSRRAIGVARNKQDRMRNQPDFGPCLGQFSQGRIQQKRHVVIDCFNNRDCRQMRRLTCLGIVDPHAREISFARLIEECPRAQRDNLKRVWRASLQILRGGPGK